MKKEIIIDGIRFTVDEELTSLDRKVTQEPEKQPGKPAAMTEREFARGLLGRVKKQ